MKLKVIPKLTGSFGPSYESVMALNHSSSSTASGSTPSSVLPVSAQQPQLARSSRGEKIPNKKIIRDLGLKVTEQRLLILEIVRRGPSHFTAQDVFEGVAAQNPGVGFATVYRFLRTLSEHTYVTEVRMGGMPARYEWAGKRHHDHLTCVVCHSINEFENTEIERLQEKVAKEFGFHLTHHLLELYGVCPECKRKEAAAPIVARTAKVPEKL